MSRASQERSAAFSGWKELECAAHPASRSLWGGRHITLGRSSEAAAYRWTVRTCTGSWHVGRHKSTLSGIRNTQSLCPDEATSRL